jgi:hypothetical protein
MLVASVVQGGGVSGTAGGVHSSILERSVLRGGRLGAAGKGAAVESTAQAEGGAEGSDSGSSM